MSRHVVVVKGLHEAGFPSEETDATVSPFRLKYVHDVPPAAFEGVADDVTAL